MTPEQHTVHTAADPRTPAGELAEIAARRPDLRAAVAANPATYPGLLQWLSGLGDPAVDAALRSRAAGPVPNQMPGAVSSPAVAAPSPFLAPGTPGYAYDPTAVPAPGSSSKVLGIVLGVVALLVVLGVVVVALFVNAVRQEMPAVPAGVGGPDLERLYELCADGDGAACDELYYSSDAGSEYEEFGDTCGGRTEGGTSCTEELPGGLDPGDADGYGSDPALDGLWDACESGDDEACSELYYESDLFSDYEYFGSTCGGREPEGTCT